MSSRLAELLAERARLQARIASQRADLALAFEPIQRAADSGQLALSKVENLFGYFKTHPQLVAGAAGVLALLQPRLAGRWLMRGTALWRQWRLLRGLRGLVPASWFGRWR
ncbi:MAG: hypothetical protein EOO25_17700 [Comamonadaceae bacterium]|nr:MAG: hypothetical protein EOO25_17700 [Comamonadaceae bacterium]